MLFTEFETQFIELKKKEYANKGYTVYGPYGPRKSDNRLHIVIESPKGKKRTVSYPKWLVEEVNGEELKPNETVHHLNGNPLDNNLENLKIINRDDHSFKDVKRAMRVLTNCVWCGEPLNRSVQSLRAAAAKGQTGPFCSATCVGEYMSAVKKGEVEPFPPIDPPKNRYFKIDNTE